MNMHQLYVVFACTNGVVALLSIGLVVTILKDLHNYPVYQMRKTIGVSSIYRAGAYWRYLRQRRQIRWLLYCGISSLLLEALFLYLSNAKI